MPKYRCHGCGAHFETRQQLGGHLSKGLACQISFKNMPSSSSVPIDPGPSSTTIAVTHNVDQLLLPVTVATVPDQQAEVAPVINAPEEAAFIYDLNQLLQRPCHAEASHRIVPAVVQNSKASYDAARTFKLHETQDAYEEYCSLVRAKHSENFWLFFSSVYQERNGVIDRVLSACKDVYVKKDGKAMFPGNVRALRHSAHEVGNFNSHILHEIVINLRQFNLGNVQVTL